MAAWPGGAGVSGSSKQRVYDRFRQVAADQGLLRFARKSVEARRERTFLAIQGYTGLPADEYLVRTIAEPEDAAFSLQELAAVGSELPKRHGRSWHPMEVQHLLLLHPSGVDWRETYGSSTGNRLRSMAASAAWLLAKRRASTSVDAPGVTLGQLADHQQGLQADTCIDGREQSSTMAA
jgi:hypothetical protein